MGLDRKTERTEEVEVVAEGCGEKKRERGVYHNRSVDRFCPEYEIQ